MKTALPGNNRVVFCMARKKSQITLSLTGDQKENLEKIALQFNQRWGNEKPNISSLIRAIADGELLIYQPGSPIPGSDREYYRKQIIALKEVICSLERLA